MGDTTVLEAVMSPMTLDNIRRGSNVFEEVIHPLDGHTKHDKNLNCVWTPNRCFVQQNEKFTHISSQTYSTYKSLQSNFLEPHTNVIHLSPTNKLHGESLLFPSSLCPTSTTHLCFTVTGYFKLSVIRFCIFRIMISHGNQWTKSLYFVIFLFFHLI